MGDLRRGLFQVPTALLSGDDDAREREIAAEETAARARGQALERESRLTRANDCRVTEAVYEALVSGSGLQAKPSLAAMRAWLSDSERLPWIALAGGTGCGKSVAAAWAIAERGGVWFRAERLMRVWSANFGDQFDEQERARDCGLLVLDDVGSEPDAGKMQTVLLELLDARKRALHSTILTTNLTIIAFKARYPNPRLHSLMRELVRWDSDPGLDMRRAAR